MSFLERYQLVLDNGRIGGVGYQLDSAAPTSAATAEQPLEYMHASCGGTPEKSRDDAGKNNYTPTAKVCVGFQPRELLGES